MRGYVGKTLRVNLSDSTVKLENLDVDKAKKFIGASIRCNPTKT